jgi:hypothetical protein
VPYAVLKKSGDDNASTGLVHHGQSWLLGQAGYRLRGAQVERLPDYAWLEGRDPGGQDYTESPAFVAASGFRELTRTKRGWRRELREPWRHDRPPS